MLVNKTNKCKGFVYFEGQNCDHNFCGNVNLFPYKNFSSVLVSSIEFLLDGRSDKFLDTTLEILLKLSISFHVIFLYILNVVYDIVPDSKKLELDFLRSWQNFVLLQR